jgi:hypothetical protein
VTALVYVCAFAPDTGESAFDVSAKVPGSTLGDALAAYPTSAGGTEFVIRKDAYPCRGGPWQSYLYRLLAGM